MILPLLLAVVAIAFAVYVYKNPPGMSCTCTKKSICMDCMDDPMSELEISLVHKMVGGYKNKQLDCINSNLKKNDGSKMDDAHSIWFDLETIKAFLCHTEMNAVKNAVAKEDLGLRIYYSRYPEKMQWGSYSDLSGVDGNYEERHTLLMIPTMLRKGVNVDFNPLDIDTYTTSLNDIEAYQNVNSTTRMPVFGGNSARRGGGTGAQNHGSIFPPESTNGHGFK